jgi:hypothetical protein
MTNASKAAPKDMGLGYDDFGPSAGGTTTDPRFRALLNRAKIEDRLDSLDSTRRRAVDLYSVDEVPNTPDTIADLSQGLNGRRVESLAKTEAERNDILAKLRAAKQRNPNNSMTDPLTGRLGFGKMYIGASGSGVEQRQQPASPSSSRVKPPLDFSESNYPSRPKAPPPDAKRQQPAARSEYVSEFMKSIRVPERIGYTFRGRTPASGRGMQSRRTNLSEEYVKNKFLAEAGAMMQLGIWPGGENPYFSEAGSGPLTFSPTGKVPIDPVHRGRTHYGEHGQLAYDIGIGRLSKQLNISRREAHGIVQDLGSVLRQKVGGRASGRSLIERGQLGHKAHFHYAPQNAALQSAIPELLSNPKKFGRAGQSLIKRLERAGSLKYNESTGSYELNRGKFGKDFLNVYDKFSKVYFNKEGPPEQQQGQQAPGMAQARVKAVEMVSTQEQMKYIRSRNAVPQKPTLKSQQDAATIGLHGSYGLTTAQGFTGETAAHDALQQMRAAEKQSELDIGAVSSSQNITMAPPVTVSAPSMGPGGGAGSAQVEARSQEAAGKTEKQQVAAMMDVENQIQTKEVASKKAEEEVKEKQAKGSTATSNSQKSSSGSGTGGSRGGSGGTNHPESEPASPGSGGYGSYGRCFV